MTISGIMEKMMANARGNLHDINHLLKVWGFARTIGEAEGLDAKTQQTLEVAAIVHDIGCPLCREKYGSTKGPLQEKEGMLLAEAFLADCDLEEDVVRRVVWLVGHHHTYEGVEGADYQILLEADYLVNAHGHGDSREEIERFRDKVFKTKTGTRLLNTIYLRN